MISKNPGKEKWKPAVPKSGLLFLAGIIWLSIGIILDSVAYSWLKSEDLRPALLISSIGFVLALLIHHFGFLRLVDKNLGRILPMDGRRCLFSFMPWKSYILVMVMMVGGFLLRHSALPKPYLALVYLAIGTALMLSSVRYLRYLIMAMRDKDLNIYHR
jgi:hypothetical protein